MVNDIARATTTKSLFEAVQDLADKAQPVDKVKYPQTNMEIEKNGTVLITVYIPNDGELSEVYEKAKELFGGIADNIYLHYDSVEKEGKKHFIDLEFCNLIRNREDE